MSLEEVVDKIVDLRDVSTSVLFGSYKMISCHVPLYLFKFLLLNYWLLFQEGMIILFVSTIKALITLATYPNHVQLRAKESMIVLITVNTLNCRTNTIASVAHTWFFVIHFKSLSNIHPLILLLIKE
jgi:hypothetical protein